METLSHNIGWMVVIAALVVDIVAMISLARHGYTWLLGWHGIKLGQATARKGNNTRLALLALLALVAGLNFSLFAGLGKPFLGINGWEDVTPNASWQYELKHPPIEKQVARSQLSSLLSEELGNGRVRRHEPTSEEAAVLDEAESLRKLDKANYVAAQEAKYPSWMHFWVAAISALLLLVYAPVAFREEIGGALQDAFEIIRNRHGGGNDATTSTSSSSSGWKTFGMVLGLEGLIALTMYIIEKKFGFKLPTGGTT